MADHTNRTINDTAAANTDVRQPYSTPVLNRYAKPGLNTHGSLTDVTQSEYGGGGDAGSFPYTASLA